MMALPANSIAPSAALVAWGLLFVIGLILWAAGRRVLMPATATIALMAGGLAGWSLGLRYDFGVPAWAWASLTAMLAMCFALLAFRAVVALGMAGILAIAAPLTVWGGAELGGRQDDSTGESMAAVLSDELSLGVPSPEAELAETPDDNLDEWWVRNPDPEPDAGGTDDDPATATPPDASLPVNLRVMTDQLPFDPEINEAVGEGVDQAAGYAVKATAWSGAVWQRTPEGLRPGMIIAAIVGALTGFLIGTVASQTSVSVVTSFGGSLLWIFASLSLTRDMGLSADPTTVFGPPVWLALWSSVAIIGLAIQWTFRRRRADKQA